ncbi:MAG: hypothetical protein ACO24P_03715 [Candidatus Nanopelagicaceae bacterium]
MTENNLKAQALTALFALATGADNTKEFYEDIETIRIALETLQVPCKMPTNRQLWMIANEYFPDEKNLDRYMDFAEAVLKLWGTSK